MSMKRVVAALAMLIASAGPAFASTGGNPASATFRLQGFVPVICRVNVNSIAGPMDDEGVVSLGVAEEFCNAPRGYRVIVQHSQNLEGAAVISNGVRIPLSTSGETVVSDIAHADIRQVAMALDVGADPSRLQSLSIRIEAKA
ncbi:MAG: hypothetical protein EON95_08350 [Caulobacteraceae bacterium]|nr:hypothetical protein [Caulobacter sp.]RYF93612.1 MAG: hypothetical protein EON95_08350 [Caulobacteraceae bacterium]